MKTPTGTVPDHISEADAKVREAEDLLKRVFAVAQIIASAPTQAIVRETDSTEKHSCSRLQ